MVRVSHFILFWAAPSAMAYIDLGFSVFGSIVFGLLATNVVNCLGGIARK